MTSITIEACGYDTRLALRKINNVLHLMMDDHRRGKNLAPSYTKSDEYGNAVLAVTVTQNSANIRPD